MENLGSQGRAGEGAAIRPVTDLPLLPRTAQTPQLELASYLLSKGSSE